MNYTIDNWHDIPWIQFHEQVKRMQRQIAVAYVNENYIERTKTQWALVKSNAACAVSIQKVMSNPGHKTPGSDNIIWDTPKDRLVALNALINLNYDEYKAKPVRRVWIPKPNGKQRPLGIPTRFDRAVQTVWALALNPIAECTGDRNSYGYRPYRSTRDAMQALYLRLGQRYGPLWVLEADIQGFFDNVNHDWVLKHIPRCKRTLNEWLKAGVLDTTGFHETEMGVPQGGPISPIIANRVLDGLEKRVLGSLQTKDKKWSTKVTIVRYADDFVVTGASPRLLEYQVKPAIVEFLKERGLSLHPDKTAMTKVTDGFDFVGYNFRLYPHAKKTRGYTFLVKPSGKSLTRIKTKIREVVKSARHWRADQLITKRNPILRGWAYYNQPVVAKQIFGNIDFYLWETIWNWCKHKAAKKGRFHKALKLQYFKTVGGRHWVFFGKTPEGKEITLFVVKGVPIKRHRLIRDLNPFLPGNEHYFKRRDKYGTLAAGFWTHKHLNVLRQTEGLCKVCGQPIEVFQEAHIHHIKPKALGGSDALRNLRRLHKACHQQVTHTKSQEQMARFEALGILKLK